MTYVKVGAVKKEKGVEPGDILIRRVRSDRYIAFRLTYGEKPKIVGLTVPCTKQQLKQSFDIDVPEGV